MRKSTATTLKGTKSGKPKAKRLRRKSLRPYPKLKAKAEKIFHLWIVKRDRYVCVTCHQYGNQAGHFRHGRLDFDEMNLNCQCPRCNKWLHGNLGIYAIYLLAKYGKDKLEDLVKRSNTPVKYTREELEKIIKKYECR